MTARPATAAERTAPTARRRAVGLVVAVAVGMALAAQSRINGELARRIGDGVVAALISFVGGLVLLLLAAAVLPHIRQGLRQVRTTLREGGLRPWQLLGGVCGGFLVITQGLAVGVVGVAVFTVAVVAGQAASSLVVDRAGLGPGGPQPVTATRIVGALLAVGAVLLAVADRLGAPAALGIAVLPALAGVGAAWQQAVNGRVATAGGPLPAALINFTTGTALILAVAVVEVALHGPPGPLPADPVLYLGGPLGLVFIAAAAAIVPLTGVLLLGLGAVTGQLIGALLLDLFVPAAGQTLPVTTLAGSGLALVAVALAAVPTRRRV